MDDARMSLSLNVLEGWVRRLPHMEEYRPWEVWYWTPDVEYTVVTGTRGRALTSSYTCIGPRYSSRVSREDVIHASTWEEHLRHLWRAMSTWASDPLV